MLFCETKEVPIAVLNIGKLKEYNSLGVANYLNSIAVKHDED